MKIQKHSIGQASCFHNSLPHFTKTVQELLLHTYELATLYQCKSCTIEFRRKCSAYKTTSSTVFLNLFRAMAHFNRPQIFGPQIPAIKFELFREVAYNQKSVAVSTPFIHDELDFFVSKLHFIQSSKVPVDTAIEFALCAKTFPQTV